MNDRCEKSIDYLWNKIVTTLYWESTSHRIEFHELEKKITAQKYKLGIRNEEQIIGKCKLKNRGKFSNVLCSGITWWRCYYRAGPTTIFCRYVPRMYFGYARLFSVPVRTFPIVCFILYFSFVLFYNQVCFEQKFQFLSNTTLCNSDAFVLNLWEFCSKSESKKKNKEMKPLRNLTTSN